MKKFIYSIFASILTAVCAIGQYHSSPFPETQPVVGYTLQPAFPTNITFTYPTAPITLTSRTNSSGNTLMYIQGKYGHIMYVNLNNPTSKVVALNNFTNTVYNADSGFLGLAFHPKKPLVFTFGVETNHGTGQIFDRLIRWNIDTNTDKIIESSRTVLINQFDRSVEHTGGAMKFGPDGYLYVSLADEGGQNGVLGNTQVITNGFFSAVMRIDVDEHPENLIPNPNPAFLGGYRIPNDNPWVGATTFNGKPVDPSRVRTEFWAVGFRNPHRMSFDTNGDLYLGDVGNSRWEELNKIIKGGNYGWNGYEGNEITTFKEATNNHTIYNYVAPLWTYPHTAIAISGYDPRFIGNCIIGGFVYRGTKYPSLAGKYLCADYASKSIWAITFGSPLKIERIAVSDNYAPNELYLNPVSGDILVACWYPGSVYKLVPAATTTGVPNTLSETGLYSTIGNNFELDDGILNYEVASPFWSDNAIKNRWILLPQNTTITRTSTNYIFPPGTVFIKNFRYNFTEGDIASQKNIETRFLIVTTNGTYGLTYKWKDDQTDALLVPDSGENDLFDVNRNGIIDQTPWHWPARSECSTCHNNLSPVLGFNDRQLNINVADTNYNGNIVNQLIKFSNIGLFSSIVNNTNGIPTLSKPNDSSYSLEHRFKSYTDANCSYCHQPGGPGRGDWDARFLTPIANSFIINGNVIDDLNVVGSKIITPGSTNLSVLYKRVSDMYAAHLPEEYHMPPLGTKERNDAGAHLIETYINSLSERTNWYLGTTGNTYTEFSIENRINDFAPGSSTKLDDDFYTEGTYPQGFNNLTTQLIVSTDEPDINWERALTNGDKTNRLHFVVGTPKQSVLRFPINKGAWMSNGVVQTALPATGNLHDITIIHKTLTKSIVLWRGGVNSNINFTLPLSLDAGPNTIEFIRTGPIVSGNGYWCTFDWISITPN